MVESSSLQNQASILTQQKAEEIQNACERFSSLFDTPEQNEDPEAIYSQQHNLNAIEEERVNKMTNGLVKFRFIRKNYLFFKFSEYGKITYLKGVHAYNKIGKQLLLVQNEVEKMKLQHDEFIAQKQIQQLMSSTEELLHKEKEQIWQICEKFYDELLTNTQQLYYLPSLRVFNQRIKNVFGGTEFQPVVSIDDSSRIRLQIRTKYDDDKKLYSLTCKRVVINKRDKIVSHIANCWRLFSVIAKRKSNIVTNIININNMNNSTKSKIKEQITASQSNNENAKNNYEIAKKIAVYLVQVNSKESELADFAIFSGITSSSLVENATNGAVTAKVIQESIVLEETASGYESAFMTKFITDARLEERLVEDIAQFISKAMSESKQDNSQEETLDKTTSSKHKTHKGNDEESIDMEVNSNIVKDFNAKFANRESDIMKYMCEAADKKTQKQRLYSSVRKTLWSAGYKGNAHKTKILSLLTPENKQRYNMLLELTA